MLGYCTSSLYVPKLYSSSQHWLTPIHLQNLKQKEWDGYSGHSYHVRLILLAIYVPQLSQCCLSCKLVWITSLQLMWSLPASVSELVCYLCWCSYVPIAWIVLSAEPSVLLSSTSLQVGEQGNFACTSPPRKAQRCSKHNPSQWASQWGQWCHLYKQEQQLCSCCVHSWKNGPASARK